MTFSFTRGFTLALALAALAMGGRSAHAQAAPVPYMNSSWLMGLGDTAAFDAKWGRFVIDGDLFTRLVYAGV